VYGALSAKLDTTNTQNTGAFVGVFVLMPAGAVISAVGCLVNTTNGSAVVTPAVYSLSGFSGTLLKQGNAMTGVVAGWQYAPLTAPLTFAVETWCFIGWLIATSGVVCASQNAFVGGYYSNATIESTPTIIPDTIDSNQPAFVVH